MKKVKDKIAREDLLDEADRIKILHTCDENARDRAQLFVTWKQEHFCVIMAMN